MNSANRKNSNRNLGRRQSTAKGNLLKQQAAEDFMTKAPSVRKLTKQELASKERALAVISQM